MRVCVVRVRARTTRAPTTMGAAPRAPWVPVAWDDGARTLRASGAREVKLTRRGLPASLRVGGVELLHGAAQLRLLRHNGRELRWMPTGALAVRRFESGFEEAHGPVHPVFYRGSLQQALGHSRREAKFLLVYLHAADHPNCETFAAAVLASQPFSAFVDENFVLWVADVAAPEGSHARRATRLSAHPTPPASRASPTAPPPNMRPTSTT